MISRHFFVKP